MNGVTTNYHLEGDKVTYESNGTDKIYYIYDSEDKLLSMNLNGSEYYYIRNAKGDIIGLFDKSGTQVVSYTYDTWGKLISMTGTLDSNVGAKNPYRYRGYRYDTETGLYYLQSRYYNAEWGRFINADGIVGNPGELLLTNMFAYCSNNPVNISDPSGQWGIPALFSVVARVVATVIATVAAVAEAAPAIAFGIVVGIAVVATAALVYEGVQLAKAVSSELAPAKPIRNKKPSHDVYVLTNSRGKAEYVGRTSQTTAVRYSQHLKTPIGKGLAPNTLAKGVDYPAARGVEQIVYDHYKLSGNNLRNSINPIEPKNPNKWYYTARGAGYFVSDPDKIVQVIEWDGR